jgi:hypothetical protein
MTKKRGPGTLGGAIDEVKDGTLLGNARRRSSRRKSKWNLLLPVVIVPLWLAIWWMNIEFACVAHIFFSGNPLPPPADWMAVLGSRMSFAHILILFAPLLPALAAGMVIGNYFIYLIPAARRAMDAEDRAFPGMAYSAAQRELTRLAVYATPVAVLLSLLGAWLLK